MGKIPKMPYFDEERDFMDSYLGRFERFAETQKWKREHWAMYLSALLKGRALDVYYRMPPEQAGDYDRLKDALQKRYLLSADGFKKRFRTAKPEAGETPSQFLTRIDNYLERWIELAKVTKSYERLKTLTVQEQYLSTCPKEMAMRLKEGKPKTITELGDVAENYIEAHATDIVFGLDPRLPKFHSAPSTTASSTARRCYLCGKVGHVQSQCLRRAPDNRQPSPSKTPGTPYAQPRAGYLQPQIPRTPSQFQRSSQPRSLPRGTVPRCFLCNRPGHIARNCLSKPTAAAELQSQREVFEESQEEIAACQPRNSTSSLSLVCRIHNRDTCIECNKPPASTHHHQAAPILAVCQDCGTHLPVIADACHAPDKTQRMPVAEGSVEGKPVSVLRDTGCSTIVVRRSLISDDKLTGQEERCILIDGTVRYTPVAEILVETPFYSGVTTAVCMKNPIYDLVIANVPRCLGCAYSSAHRTDNTNSSNPESDEEH